MAEQSFGKRVTAGFWSVLSPFSSSDHLADVTISDLYPDLDVDELAELVPLSRSAAMKIPAIAKCRHTLVTAIAQLDLRAVGVRSTPPALIASQLDPAKPNIVTLATLVDELYFYGRAWLMVLRRNADPAARPASLRAVPDRNIEYNDDGQPYRAFGRPVPPDDFVLVEGITDGILSPSAGLTIRRARRTDNASARAMDNPVPSIELHQTAGDPLTKSEREDLVKHWAEARRGRNGGVAYTNPSIEAKTHGQAAEQLLIHGRNASALDCARVSGMPAWVVDIGVEGSSLTYSNVPSRSREFLDYTAKGYLGAIAGRLSMDDLTPHGVSVRFDVSPLLRGDFADRMNAGKTAIEAGIYDAEEIRAMDPDTPDTRQDGSR